MFEVGTTILEEVFPRSLDLSLLLETIIALFTTRGFCIFTTRSISFFAFTFTLEPSFFFLFRLLFIFRIATEDDVADWVHLGHSN